MWLERIIEAKKKKGISAKTMSDHTGGHLPERTITRILNGETAFPRIDTILELGQCVGLTAQELFAETTTRATDYDMARLQAELEAQMADKEYCIKELEDKIASLNDKVVSLTAENDVLRLKLEHKEEILAHKEEILEHKEKIIRLHNKYTEYIDTLAKKD